MERLPVISVGFGSLPEGCSRYTMLSDGTACSSRGAIPLCGLVWKDGDHDAPSSLPVWVNLVAGYPSLQFFNFPLVWMVLSAFSNLSLTANNFVGRMLCQSRLHCIVNYLVLHCCYRDLGMELYDVMIIFTLSGAPFCFSVLVVLPAYYSICLYGQIIVYLI